MSTDTYVSQQQATSSVTPEPVVRLASGFMAAKLLFAANELGIFEALDDGPTALDGLAARTGLPRRTTRIVADAMVALGLVERDGALYRNSAVAARFLTRPGPGDLRPLLRFWDRVSYPGWVQFTDALVHGPTTQVFDLPDELQRIQAEGIEAVLAGPTAAIPDVVDLGASRRLLDIGGGTGAWSLSLVRRYPGLTATVLELPIQAQVARQRVAEAGATDRIDVVTGDAMRDDLPTGYDAFLVANLVHYWSPSDNTALLRRIRTAAGERARLVLADFWTDETHTRPPQAALMAGEFAAFLRNGDVYSADEVRDWLERTGWRFVYHRPLVGPQSVIVADAV